MMLKQFAKFDVSGRFANDPSLTFTGNGKALATCESDYLPFIAWENTAKYIKDHLGQGDVVYLKGFIKSKFKDGKLTSPDYVVTEVVAYEKKKGENDGLSREN